MNKPSDAEAQRPQTAHDAVMAVSISDLQPKLKEGLEDLQRQLKEAEARGDAKAVRELNRAIKSWTETARTIGNLGY